MNRFTLRAASWLMAGAAAAGFAADASAIGWPSHYEGVMLQGFYWDSFADSKWTKLEAQVDELSSAFSLIWIPNSGKAGTGNQMGYMPQYWFTNHNSSFGTEAQLLSMIQAYKLKGTGFIADCVINHRNGVTNWYDFPKEQWNGTTWSIGLEGICGNDEMAYASGQPKPTGAYDTGDGFDGCRDLDHTNANVQNNCKNYIKCLQEKYGYAGMRYDMVKGYGGQYTKIYNQYANVEFSVGEYWDGQYDAVKAWIDATGKTSAAFDFPLKYCMNEAFTSGDLTKLVWKANGTTDQPAGMIHFGYPRYSVTFVDNHDTYRDGSKFTGNVIAANAFILFSPGTPCVFLPHYQAYKDEIRRMIAIRNAVGVHNESAVTVLRTQRDCYMAEVTGSKGKVVIKVGGAMVSPSGYTDADIKAYGTDYCVWTKVDIPELGGGGGGEYTDPMPDKFYILGHADGNDWHYATGVEMLKEGDCFTATVDFAQPVVTKADDNRAYFSFAQRLGTSWDDINEYGNRYAPALDTELRPDSDVVALTPSATPASAKAYCVQPGKYKVTINWKDKTIALTSPSAVEEIAVEEAGDAEWFTLQGTRVAQPEAGGIYIRVRAGKAAKVLAQ